MIRPPIQRRLFTVGLGVIAAIIAATGILIDMQRRASIDAFRTATVNLGSGMARQTEQALASVDQAICEIQRDLMAEPHASAKDLMAAMRLKSVFDTLLEQHRRLKNVEALSAVDADGMLAATSRGWPSKPVDLSGSEFFNHFRGDDDHAVFVSTPVKDKVSGKWTTVMARRVDDAHGGFAGVVVAEISLSGLQAFYQLAMPVRRSVYVLRQDGIILVRYPSRDDEIGKKIPDQSPWYGVVARGGGTYHAAGYFDPTQMIASVNTLHNLPVVVETAVTETDTLSQWYVQRVWLVAGAISASIGVIIILRLFATQYRRVELSELSLARKNAELDAAHEKLQVTLDNLSQGVCLYTADQKIEFFNRRYCEIYGVSADAIRPGMSAIELANLRIANGTARADAVNAYVASLDALLREGKPFDMTTELASGRTVARHVQPLPGKRWLVTLEDITDRLEAEARITFLARHDTLTGLANRALFQERLDQALAMADRGKGFALLCLDLDRFKAVNDTLGHPAGDALLRAVANRLRDVVREGDTIARLGGDEFAILQVAISELAEVTALARRIVSAVGEPFELDGHEVRVGTSIGIAMAPGDSSESGQLMKHADQALYRSKQEGRGTWRFFEPRMDGLAKARRALEADLRNALPLGQLTVHYQPLVRGQTRILSGFEALLRWNHPTRGLVPPDEFISIAEEIGLIGDIGAWVLRQACIEATAWPNHLRVAVNLSTRQFRGSSLVDTVAEAIRLSGIAPHRIELEITEAVPLQQDKATLATLHALRALGVSIALDDFGTRYSSLSYLRGFRFDTIKIDRSFVNDLETRDESAAIVRAIIGLATSLRMNVTADCVETEGQFAFLTAAGCHRIQGYVISQPVPASELPALIARLSGELAGPALVPVMDGDSMS